MDQASPKKIVTPFKALVPPSSLAPFSWVPWLTTIGTALLIFVIVTWLILVSNEVRDFNRSCAETMRAHAHNHPRMRQFFWLITWVGGIVSLTILGSTGTLTMFFRRDYLLAGIWVLATAGGALLNLAVKHTVENPRPEPATRDPFVAWIDNPSYPSGHAMGSAIGLGMCLFVALRFLKRKSAKALSAAGVVLLILLIGFSRVYLRAHWLTDVLGGYALGTSWLVLCLAIHGRFQKRFALPGRIE
jgi:membrane-associated phospholipid phosphatase